jgi:hypothetical protein
MEGEQREGVFKTPEGGWVKVEYRHYPTKRLVVRQMLMTDGGLRYADDMTPDLTPQWWDRLSDWLK